MARRYAPITIDLDTLTPDELADAREIAAVGGVAWTAAALADPPVPLLAGLIFVTLRRASPGITPRRCTRLALEAKGIDRGA